MQQEVEPQANAAVENGPSLGTILRVILWAFPKALVVFMVYGIFVLGYRVRNGRGSYHQLEQEHGFVVITGALVLWSLWSLWPVLRRTDATSGK